MWKPQPAPLLGPKWPLAQRATTACCHFPYGCEESISCDGIIISQLAQAVFHGYILLQKKGQGEQKCLTVVMIGVLVIF